MSLKDITNTVHNSADFHGVKKRRKLNNGSYKEYRYSKARKQFELQFASEAEKLQFENSLDSFKKQFGLKTLKDVFEHFFHSKHDTDFRKEDTRENV